MSYYWDTTYSKHMKTIHKFMQIEWIRKSVQERLNKKVVKEKDCWTYNSKAKHEKGYPVIGIGGRSGMKTRVSRLMYYLTYGPFNENLLMCHKCDNPECVNPNHLFLGTHADNMRDKKEKGRATSPPIHKGEAHPRAKFTEEAIRFIRESEISYSNLAAIFNTTITSIWRIKKRKAWTHVKD